MKLRQPTSGHRGHTRFPVGTHARGSPVRTQARQGGRAMARAPLGEFARTQSERRLGEVVFERGLLPGRIAGRCLGVPRRRAGGNQGASAVVRQYRTSFERQVRSEGHAWWTKAAIRPFRITLSPLTLFTHPNPSPSLFLVDREPGGDASGRGGLVGFSGASRD